MAIKKLKCPRCGRKFPNGGVFWLCPDCRHPFTEAEKALQGGCHHYEGLPDAADRRVTRVKRDSESF